MNSWSCFCDYDETGLYLFHWATVENKSSVVRLLLQHNYCTIDDIREGLHWEKIIEVGNIKMIRILIRYGFSTNDLRQCDNIALSIGCERGNVKIVRFLIRQGLSSTDLCFDNYVFFEKACLNGHLKLLKYLIRHGCLTYVANPFIWTNILAIACRGGYLRIVKYLIKRGGLHINDLRCHENYFFRSACENGHLHIARFLWNKGLTREDIRARANDALASAVAHAHVSIVDFLFNTGGLNIDDLRTSCLRQYGIGYKQNWLEMMQLLIQNGLTANDISTQKTYFQTALLDESNAKENLTFLIQKLSLTTEHLRAHDNYLLHKVVYLGNVPILMFLMQKGLTLMDLQSRENTAIQTACERGHLPVVQLLLEYGLTTHDITFANNRAIQKAKWNYHHNVVNYLIHFLATKSQTNLKRKHI